MTFILILASINGVKESFPAISKVELGKSKEAKIFFLVRSNASMLMTNKSNNLLSFLIKSPNTFSTTYCHGISITVFFIYFSEVPPKSIISLLFQALPNIELILTFMSNNLQPRLHSNFTTFYYHFHIHFQGPQSFS